MTTREITEALGVSTLVRTRDVKTVVQHPSSADADSIFVCIRGARHDGHDHAAKAYAHGCRLFVAERPLHLPLDATVLTVDNTRSALARLACKQYGDPARKMRIIGVTGMAITSAYGYRS